jgi:transposase
VYFVLDIMTFDVGVRNTAVFMYKTHIRSCRRVAELTNTSKSSVHRWVNSHPATRQSSRVPSQRRITETMQSAIRTQLDSNPYSTVRQVAEQLQQALHVTLSHTCVRGQIKRLGYTRKRTYKRAPNTDALAETRDVFVQRVRSESISEHEIISVDETCFYLHMRPRLGYAPKGKRLTQPVHAGRHFKCTLILAVCSQGVLHWELLPGSARTSSFADFVSEIPVLPDHKYVLMDNASFHKSDTVCARLRANSGLQPLFTPPYTPEWNPVECTFSVLKSAYRKHHTPSSDARDPFAIMETTLHACFDEDMAEYNPAATFAHVWRAILAGRSE